MINRATVLMLGILLAGCNTTQKQPVILPYPVALPIAGSCAIPPPPEPVWDSDTLPDNPKPVDQLKAVLADLATARGYIGELQATLIACQ